MKFQIVRFIILSIMNDKKSADKVIKAFIKLRAERYHNRTPDAAFVVF